MSGKVAFRVRRPYFDAVEGGSKTVEIRRASAYWLAAMNRGPREAVFVCGREVHRRAIRVVRAEESMLEGQVQACLPAEMRGRVSDDVGPGPVVAFYLGESRAEGAKVRPTRPRRRRPRGRRLRQRSLGST